MENFVEKSKVDTCEYRYIKLENQLEWLLAFDKDTEKSAVAMDVGVGSALQPKDTPGLPHFLEHMLFMGSEKYPRVNEYADFVVNNGGFLNAYTGFWNTNYHFSIANEELEKGIDIFSNIFIHPLLDKSWVNKEINAVNSECEKNLQSDSWRFYQLFNNCSNPDSAYNHFAWGNLSTLSQEDIYDKLKEFYDKWYSANIMKLVVYSNIQLDTLEELIKDKFSLISNK